MVNPELGDSKYGEYRRDNESDSGGRRDDGGGEDAVHSMAKLQRYASCDAAYNRQLVGRILVDIFRSAVDHGTPLNVSQVMQPIHKLVNDTDASVRLELMEQLPHVAMICQEAPERFGNVLSNHLIHLIATFLHDEDQQVRNSTHTALLTLIERGLLDKDSILLVLAPTLLMMGQQPAKLEYVTLAIDGMSKVAPLLDPATAERLFLKRYLSLCCDDNFFFRKLCAMHLGEFAASMEKEVVYEKLLPTYVSLCKDPVWTVRKSCAEGMVSIACCVSLEHRRNTLSPILADFLDDESKWVRLLAYQILGPFILTFAKQFTGFAYNQYGELVLTDQHGTELRISFTGSAESSAACKSSTDEDCDNNSEGLNSPLLVSNETNVTARKAQTKQKYDDSNEKYDETVNDLDLDVKIDHQTLDDDLASTDPNQFSPFLYYYIPPDLPLDDELVRAVTEAAKLSGTTTESIKNEDQNDTSNDSNIPVIQVTIPEDDKKNHIDKLPEAELENNSNECPEALVVVNDSSSEVDSMSNNPSESDSNEIDTKNQSSESRDLNETVDVSVDTSSEVSFCEKQHHPTIKSVTNVGSQTIVPQVLIDFFVSMANSETWWTLASAEIPRFCAFYFPAVVLTLGRENWGMLKVAYGYLSDAREYKVRRTMASSIHEVAMILGAELSAQDLLPIYDGFVKDLDEVRIGALKHLATFLKVLTPVDRCQFLPKIKGFLTQNTEWNACTWRFREEIARRLLETIPLYDPCDIYTHIAPLSFPLLVDKVAAVRHMALALVTQIISYLSTDHTRVTAMIQDLRMMLTDNSLRWTYRQTYALLCASLLSNEAISGERFSKELLPCLLSLSSDVVPNVRLCVVRTLTSQRCKMLNTLGPEQFAKINQQVQAFRHDPDRDVRMLAGGIAGKYQAKSSDE
ncbi:serine/threonine-protein phosphatase 4 regulatory subunit 1-like isoform X2 [Diachasmimorpha longicaudata]|uniref:serine/threonine-protein phosphatase 4 regulatory subunit 1-like isoform X2 n=1 Tax=Diachasmimorpha longicaudata TaxID=58733 RepID=UPI0030B8BAF1